MYLVALFPPANIQRILAAAQTEVFRESGSAGGLALPPLVPLGFYTSEPEQPAGSGRVQERVLRNGGYAVRGVNLYLDILPAGEIKRIGRWIEANPSPPLFPLHPGVPIGIELERPEEFATRTPPQVTWKTCALTCLSIESRNESVWWGNLAYTECWRVKIKRKL
jgi:hypothetical protein